jgi:hypothetical protein
MEALFRKTKWNRTGMTTGRPKKWDRDAVVRFFCAKMSEGHTIGEIQRKIGYPSFLSMIDELESDKGADSTQLLVLYRRARREQARSWAESTSEIATGRDPFSRQMIRKMDRILKKELRRALRRGGKKSALDMVARILEARSGIKELDKNLIARNRLMIDANKWLAGVTDPAYRNTTTNVIATPSGEGEKTEFIVKFIKPGRDEEASDG